MIGVRPRNVKQEKPGWVVNQRAEKGTGDTVTSF